VGLFLNIGLNALFIFVFHMGLAGLALASVFSSCVNCMILYAVLRRRVGVCDDSGLGDRLARCSLAAGVMALAAFAVARLCLRSPAQLGPLLGVVLFSAAVYGVMLYLLRVPEIREVWAWWVRKR
jgi:peptidoglycan biosynthesis protein MviN/MurJ (putative lipid II flippase)